MTQQTTTSWCIVVGSCWGSHRPMWVQHQPQRRLAQRRHYCFFNSFEQWDHCPKNQLEQPMASLILRLLWGGGKAAVEKAKEKGMCGSEESKKEVPPEQEPIKEVPAEQESNEEVPAEQEPDPLKDQLGKVLYEDDGVAVCENGVELKWFYFPRGTSKLALYSDLLDATDVWKDKMWGMGFTGVWWANSCNRSGRGIKLSFKSFRSNWGRGAGFQCENKDKQKDVCEMIKKKIQEHADGAVPEGVHM